MKKIILWISLIIILAITVGIVNFAINFNANNVNFNTNKKSDNNEQDYLTINVYFGNSLKDPEAMDCSLVFPVERKIKKTEAVGRAALEELLKGPTAEEKNEGYFSSINEGVKINSLVIENGVAKADFDEKLEYQVGGSCRVLAIASQIRQTLKQFSSVNNVIISINGRTEDILQP
ncbi:MAG: GerMN domain-containing protein [Candidatus Paceibacterota bacterium]